MGSTTSETILRRGSLWLLVLLAVAACGGSSNGAPWTRRDLAEAALARKAIAYSGYRAGQSPDLQIYPSEAEIKADLDLLVRGGWTLLRLFDSGPHAERVLKVIKDHQLDMKVMLGVWIAGAPDGHDAANREQMERCIALAAAYPDQVVAVSVGNETLDDWSNVRVSPQDLAAYILEVRDRVAVPVTTDDSWLPFTLTADGETSYADVIEVLEVVDFLAIHVYAFADAFYGSWNWKQEAHAEAGRAAAMMDAALAYSKQSVASVQAVLDQHGLERPILITEIGWKSETHANAESPPEDAIERFFAHPVNQKMFNDAVTDWVYGSRRAADAPRAAFLFEAFDEPWKGEWGDDGWGLFDVERRPKYVVWDLYPDLRPADAPAYSASDAVYYRP
jgi:exo-beta-1,3-glucanase (GH17 family)